MGIIDCDTHLDARELLIPTSKRAAALLAILALSLSMSPARAQEPPVTVTTLLSQTLEGPTGPEELTLRAGESGPGSQGPVVQHPGPVVYYVRSGETAISLVDGVRLYREGDSFSIPPFTPYQYTNMGTSTNRSLYLLVTPIGAPVSELLPDVSLPQP